MTELPLTPQRVLALAADDCAENWCAGRNENDKGQRCMLGAINFASGIPVSYYNRENDFDVVIDPDLEILRDNALELVIVQAGIPRISTLRAHQSNLTDTITDFNDSNDQDTVVAALRKGAA